MQKFLSKPSLGPCSVLRSSLTDWPHAERWTCATTSQSGVHPIAGAVIPGKSKRVAQYVADSLRKVHALSMDFDNLTAVEGGTYAA